MDIKIKKLLDSNKIKYNLVEHRKVYTAFNGAETQHADPKAVVKTVLVKLSKPTIHLMMESNIKSLDFVLVAVPAKKRVDFKKIAKAVNEHAMKSYLLLTKTLVGTKRAAKAGPYKKPIPISTKMASEKDIIKKLKTKVGLLAPFSQLYNLPLLFDKKLAKNKKLIVPAGSYTESLEISTKDFLRLMAGMQGNFTE